MNIQDVPQGINVVVETSDLVYIGRFRQTEPGVVRLQDCAIQQCRKGQAEAFVRKTAKYGIEVQERDVMVRSGNVLRVRALKDIPKPE